MLTSGTSGAQPPPTPYIPGEGVNHLTPRVQFHANECNEGRDANPQPQERNSTPTSGTNSPKRMRKSRGPSIYACTRSITINFTRFIPEFVAA